MEASSGVQKFKGKGVWYAYGKLGHIAKYYSQQKDKPQAKPIKEQEIIVVVVLEETLAFNPIGCIVNTSPSRHIYSNPSLLQ